MNNPYETLGLEHGASEQEVKKAYKTLAKKFHPDKKGGTEDEFKKINEAYTQIMKGEDPMDAFPEMNEIFSMFTAAMMHGRSFMKGPLILTMLELSLEEIENGGDFKVSYKRRVPTGKIISSVQNTPFGAINTVMPEEIEKEYELEINVPRCYNTKNPLLMENAAKADGVIPGDLEVHIVQKEHSLYTRIGGSLNLQTEMNISLKESLVGFVREIKLLNSEEIVKIECSTVANYYESKRIENHGMKLDENTYGDLLIKFNIRFPLVLSNESIELLKNMDDLSI